MNCPNCGAYVPTNARICVACGAIVAARFYPESDYLFINGEKIPIDVQFTELMESDELVYRDEKGRLIIERCDPIRKFTVIEKKRAYKEKPDDF